MERVKDANSSKMGKMIVGIKSLKTPRRLLNR